MKESCYEYFLKDSLLDFLLKNNIVIKNMDKLCITFKDYKVNTRSIKKLFALSCFKVIAIKKIKPKTYLVKYTKNTKRYNKEVEVIMTEGNLFYPKGIAVEYYSFMLKKTMKLLVYSNEELTCDLFYDILENKEKDMQNLWEFLCLVSKNLNWTDLVLSIFALYQGKMKKLDTNTLRENLKKLDTKAMHKKWEEFIDTNIFIKYSLDEIIEILKNLIDMLDKWKGSE